MLKSEEKVFRELDALRLKYERADNIRKTFQAQMENSLEGIDWYDDEEMILRIIGHLPQCYLRFRLYSRFYELHDAEKGDADIDAKPSSQQGEGGENGG